MNKKGKTKKEDLIVLSLFIVLLVITVFFVVFMRPQGTDITGLASSPPSGSPEGTPEETPSPGVQVPWCIGLPKSKTNPLEKGNCTNKTRVYNDFCSVPSILIEFYCENDQCLRKETNCSEFYTDGVCDRKTGTCLKTETSGDQDDEENTTGSVDTSNGKSSSGSTNGDGCISKWKCSWTDCKDGIQGWLCADLNNCNTTVNRPLSHGNIRTCGGDTNTSLDLDRDIRQGDEIDKETGKDDEAKREEKAKLLTYLAIGIFCIFVFAIIILLILSKQKNTGGIVSSDKPTKKEIKEVFGDELKDIKE